MDAARPAANRRSGSARDEQISPTCVGPELAMNLRLICRNGALVVLFTLSLAAVPACQTMEGAGRDIQTAGEAVEEAAD